MSRVACCTGGPCASHRALQPKPEPAVLRCRRLQGPKPSASSGRCRPAARCTMTRCSCPKLLPLALKLATFRVQWLLLECPKLSSLRAVCLLAGLPVVQRPGRRRQLQHHHAVHAHRGRLPAGLMRGALKSMQGTAWHAPPLSQPGRASEPLRGPAGEGAAPAWWPARKAVCA